MRNLLRSRAARALLFFATATAASCAGETVEPADLVLLGGTVVTGDDSIPDGQALAARGGRIVAVGTDKEIRRYVGDSTEVVELAGATAFPGLIEGHAHYTGVGQAKLQLDLTTVANWDEIVAKVQAAVAQTQPGELITGRGWHQEKWDRRPEPNVDGLPFHDALSAVSPDNPVILTHASGHATLANAKAMELSGITRSTPDPEGGEIVRDAAGNPIGAFRETASGLLRGARQSAAPQDPRRVILLAQEEAFSKGITSFHDAGTGFETVDLMKQMVDDGSLKIRLYVMLNASNEELAEKMDAYRMIGYGDNRLTVRAIKRLMDGALGSHGAWLLEPYDDLPTSTGLNTTPVAELDETARLAIEHGYQLCVHAIGDRANRETLDLYGRAFFAHPALTDLRWRIEHAQHLAAADIQRFGQLGVIAAMQGVHATSDGPWVEAKLGARRAEEGAYVWQKLMQSGAVVVNGTDAPVEDVDPLRSYYASVSRMMNNGQRFYPDQRMSRMEALKSYTSNAAFAAFEEGLKGTLAPGKLADVTVLSKNILAIPEEEIPTTKVVMTIVGGEVVYRAGNGG
jgi:predicted amidohydrolase YtcJ